MAHFISVPCVPDGGSEGKLLFFCLHPNIYRCINKSIIIANACGLHGSDVKKQTDIPLTWSSSHQCSAMVRNVLFRLRTMMPAAEKKWGCRSDNLITPLPTQSWQQCTCILSDGVKQSSPYHTLTFSHPSILYASLPTATQSSWLVICDLPVCWCNKVSTQLRMHFPGTSPTNHSLESLDTHTHTLPHLSHESNGTQMATWNN